MPPLDPALGLRAGSRNDLNRELVAGLAEGRKRRLAGQLLVFRRLAIHHVEILVVGVKRPRDTVEHDPPPQDPHGPFCRLLLEELAVHPRRGVVDEIDQARLVAPPEPVVGVPSICTSSPKCSLGCSPPAVRPSLLFLLPQPLDDQPPPQRLVRNPEPHLEELLGRQGRPSPSSRVRHCSRLCRLLSASSIRFDGCPRDRCTRPLAPSARYLFQILLPCRCMLSESRPAAATTVCRPAFTASSSTSRALSFKLSPTHPLHPCPLSEGTFLSSYRGDTFMEVRPRASGFLTRQHAPLTPPLPSGREPK